MTDIVELAKKIVNLNTLHTGISNKTISISDSLRPTISVDIQDKRLEDLIWNLYIEALKEMRDNSPDLTQTGE